MSTPKRKPLGDLTQGTFESSPLNYPSSALKSRLNSDGGLESSQPFSPTRSRLRNVSPEPASALNLESDMRIESEGGVVKQIVWGTNVVLQESMEMFRDFLKNYVPDENSEPFYPRLLGQMAAAESFYLNLNCHNLYSYEPSRKLYYQLLRFPQEILPVMDHVTTSFVTEMMLDVEMPPTGFIVRPFNIKSRTVSMRDLDPSDIDQLICVKGLMIRTSPVIPDMKKGFFRCSKCEQTVMQEIDRGKIIEPTSCPNCRQANSMVLVHNRCEFSNKQVGRMQELTDETPDGQTPYTVSLYMYDDLIDVAKPGDRVEITGVYRAVPVRVNPRRRSVKAQFKTYLDVVHIKRTDKSRIGMDTSIDDSPENKTAYIEGDVLIQQDPMEIQKLVDISKRPDVYELLSASLAPSIFGMEDVKKGVLLQLFGGTYKFREDKPGSPKIRGDINILLVGDPGVSKSQLLKYVHQVAPRGIYTSGKGSSAVGLTAYITRDPDTKQNVLESGALVLSDGGICCIDEFDKMSEQTRSVLHEVMEQQTISIAKAGIITTLNARTSILASANPIRSKFDERLSVVENINIPPPLLSRFDLVYLVLDKPNERDDRLLAQHIVSLFLDEQLARNEDVLPKETFAQYIRFARANFKPQITQEAGDALINHYVSMRKWGRDGMANQKVVSATTRQLESMIRLAEGHAKMRMSNEVTIEDVNEAHRLISSAMHKAYIDPQTGRIDMDLISTGISYKKRVEQSELRGQVMSIVQALEKTSIRFGDIVMKLNESGVRVNENELEQVLDSLAGEDAFGVKGRTRAEKIIHKK